MASQPANPILTFTAAKRCVNEGLIFHGRAQKYTERIPLDPRPTHTLNPHPTERLINRCLVTLCDSAMPASVTFFVLAEESLARPEERSLADWLLLRRSCWYGECHDPAFTEVKRCINETWIVGRVTAE
jgi:hypothetical protein